MLSHFHPPHCAWDEPHGDSYFQDNERPEEQILGQNPFKLY